ncbi:hypothetical protein LMIY3S_03691 [Labrys miyagiensis]
MDFDNLVLAPCMAAFGIPLTVTPIKSQPGQPAYAAQGIYDRTQSTVMMEDGSELASTRVTVGIRLSTFAVPPRQGDQVLKDGIRYEIDAAFPDGQGGAELVLKELR